ncbi:CRISPR-associated endonuclease Cas2 [Spiroplasma apis]|uniref:CRISPR-associated endoribonuclease Cas2 n=1 Tax=Spiroplasma apis B31 TaxID=1276258 RepID=V5RKD9_SPIAP|nr:CRISPR-associated endonuclease Cas2 [Spiroplasma apis]AHB36275.1 CRISPR-associated protein Cas2 [Spiroplasma apis B31]
MRLFVFYDLPNTTKGENKEYTKFRRILIQNGFYMIQFSIYVKLCINYDQMLIYQKKIENFKPKKGDVRMIGITEKQYKDMKILVGSKTFQEENQNIDFILEL